MILAWDCIYRIQVTVTLALPHMHTACPHHG